MGKGSVELLEQTLGCTLTAARAVYNGEATAAEILEESRGPAPGQSPGRSGSNERIATNGRAASQVSGTNPEPSAQDASPARRERAFGQQKTPRFAGLLEERLKGLEPSTFCMASRRSSQLSYSRAEPRL